MSKNSKIIKNICDQVKWCLQNIDYSATTAKDYQLTRKEICHMDLLLKLMLSTIDIPTYIVNFEKIFSGKKTTDYYEMYSAQLKFLKNLKKHSFFTNRNCDIVTVDTEIVCFVDILKICYGNIQKHLDCGDYDLIRKEIYCNHNVHSLIETKNKDLIDYYFEVEIPRYNVLPKPIIQSYTQAWEKAKKQFLRA